MLNRIKGKIIRIANNYKTTINFIILQKKYKENVLTSLTPTKYNIKYKSIDTLKL